MSLGTTSLWTSLLIGGSKIGLEVNPDCNPGAGLLPRARSEDPSIGESGGQTEGLKFVLKNLNALHFLMLQMPSLPLCGITGMTSQESSAVVKLGYAFSPGNVFNCKLHLQRHA